MKLNKITKKHAMECLNGKVQFIGSYINVDYIQVAKSLFINFEEKVKPYLQNTEIRECVKQTNAQIKFKRGNGEYIYLSQIINSKWYEAIIENKKFIIIEGCDGFTTCYHILED